MYHCPGLKKKPKTPSSLLGDQDPVVRRSVDAYYDLNSKAIKLLANDVSVLTEKLNLLEQTTKTMLQTTQRIEVSLAQLFGQASQKELMDEGQAILSRTMLSVAREMIDVTLDNTPAPGNVVSDVIRRLDNFSSLGEDPTLPAHIRALLLSEKGEPNGMAAVVDTAMASPFARGRLIARLKKMYAVV